ncbi:hypothetical protein IE53DRAFT_184373 [Violaceomyces palustris]|uniref:Uncharacterized protein n=1 Tax=Violaceomyces palustris TaxID=1673888 RepID=A0ACD0NSC5_9BASI|nr:hypothetical protein IE53DRAFT_184373 [Violaceomyces palustris]
MAFLHPTPLFRSSLTAAFKLEGGHRSESPHKQDPGPPTPPVHPPCRRVSQRLDSIRFRSIHALTGLARSLKWTRVTRHSLLTTQDYSHALQFGWYASPTRNTHTVARIKKHGSIPHRRGFSFSFPVFLSFSPPYVPSDPLPLLPRSPSASTHLSPL